MKKTFLHYFDQQKLDALHKKKKSDEKFSGIVAILFFILFLIIMIGADANEKPTVAMIIVLIIAVFAFLVCSGEKMYCDVFKKCLPILTNDPDITCEQLAQQTGQRTETVRSALKSMITKGVLSGLAFSDEKDCFVDADEIKPNIELMTVECPNCGAPCNVPEGGQAKCEYCNTYFKNNK